MYVYIYFDCLVFWVYRSVAKKSENMIYLEWSKESINFRTRKSKCFNRMGIVKTMFNWNILGEESSPSSNIFYFWSHQCI